jgi:hypothetical protein
MRDRSFVKLFIRVTTLRLRKLHPYRFVAYIHVGKNKSSHVSTHTHNAPISAGSHIVASIPEKSTEAAYLDNQWFSEIWDGYRKWVVETT